MEAFKNTSHVPDPHDRGERGGRTIATFDGSRDPAGGGTRGSVGGDRGESVSVDNVYG